MKYLLLLLATLLAPSIAAAEFVDIEIPDEMLVDQDGRQIRLPTLLADKAVVMSFAFTTCTTICSPMTAVLGRLQDEVAGRLGRDVRLVTISLDPRTDTPERLAAYAAKFDRREGWSFLTGSSETVKRVLQALGGWVPVKEKHTPLVLVGNAATGKWKRVHGLSSPEKLAAEIEAIAPEKQARSFAGPDADQAAEAWFTNTEFVDQNGKRHRFYADLLRGKKVLINFGFASCKTACSPITANLAQVQRLLGDAVGRDVHMITITVDPKRDGPMQLRQFAEKFQAGKGWYFLTGEPADVEKVLRKLGGWTDDPEGHNTGVLIGDTGSGHWIKALAMAAPAELARAVEQIDDPQG